jgi:hypothetical protein
MHEKKMLRNCWQSWIQQHEAKRAKCVEIERTGEKRCAETRLKVHPEREASWHRPLPRPLG